MSIWSLLMPISWFSSRSWEILKKIFFFSSTIIIIFFFIISIVLLLYIFILLFNDNGCHSYLQHYHLQKLHWCLEYLFPLNICNLTFFLTSFHEVPYSWIFYFFVFSNLDIFSRFCNQQPCDQTCDNNENIHRMFFYIWGIFDLSTSQLPSSSIPSFVSKPLL